jgi:predicted anti-sigma-YlaC factor YlaD
MTCKKNREQIMKFYDNTISEKELAVLEEHMSTCDSCKSLLNEYAGIFQRMESLTVPAAEPELESDVMERVRRMDLPGWEKGDGFKSALAGSLGLMAVLLVLHLGLHVLMVSIFDLLSSMFYSVMTVVETATLFQFIYTFISVFYPGILWETALFVMAFFLMSAAGALLTLLYRLIIPRIQVNHLDA